MVNEVKTSVKLSVSWPGSPPDLVPITNCWTMMKKAEVVNKPSAAHELQEAIKHTWVEN